MLAPSGSWKMCTFSDPCSTAFFQKPPCHAPGTQNKNKQPDGRERTGHPKGKRAGCSGASAARQTRAWCCSSWSCVCNMMRRKEIGKPQRRTISTNAPQPVQSTRSQEANAKRQAAIANVVPYTSTRGRRLTSRRSEQCFLWWRVCFPHSLFWSGVTNPDIAELLCIPT
jgi:hypothetical protein